MKLCIYQTNPEMIHLNCLNSLAASGYRVELNDTGKGYIHAIKDGISRCIIHLIDLRVFREKYAVTVSVISSNLSKLFGNFCHNRLDEETFVEHFLAGLREGRIVEETPLPAKELAW
jgi:hypothetical protein